MKNINSANVNMGLLFELWHGHFTVNAFTVNLQLNNQTLLLITPKEINIIFFRDITVLALTNNIAHDTNGLLINELSEVAPHSSNIF